MGDNRGDNLPGGEQSAGCPSGRGGVGRRAVLGGATGVVAASMCGVALTAEAGTAPVADRAAASARWGHAAGVLRGSDIAVRAGRDKEGRFGVMFKNADGFAPPDALLKSLAGEMGEPAGPNAFDLDNPRIPAGFTFLGQFIDHDMTLDRTPVPDQEVDPLALTNFDTPQFDLGSLYGRGPQLDPDLYEPGGSGRMRVVRTAQGVDDLPRRADGTAFVGDARNDENLIVSQLHLVFAKFHNRCLETGLARTLAQAQQLTRWHFQWIIVHDFLERVVGADVVNRFLGVSGRVSREFYKPKNPNRPMMPIEYSVAGYRFGHSMIRAAYLMNARTAPPVVAPIFGAEGADLRGSRPLPARLEIDWRHFFAVPGQPDAPRNQARRIDAKLSRPLFDLPPTVVSDAMTSLAERNLIRGKRLGLPAGQDVATRMGEPALNNTQLGLPDPNNPGWAGKAPLWFYVLRESELKAGGERLGPVGGRLVAEVILGILDADKASYLHAKPGFTPKAPVAGAGGQFRMGDFIKFAQNLR
jgi:hypothetical protein